MKRPAPKTLQEQWEEKVGKDCIIEPPSPSIGSFIVIWVVWIIFIITLFICSFIV